ncbi:MAG TPA: MFS transporter [Saprospiraceae bacterium]|nr:MFS transporter [Saprospiraceae bacterium]
MIQAAPGQVPWHILPVIIISQFCGTALWFAGNAVLPSLVEGYGLAANSLGYLTSTVQLGFILGTLVFAFLLIADRFSPVAVFLVCALLGAGFNLSMAFIEVRLDYFLLLRFLTGICLAGIYPVGMKIAADWYETGLGKALGYLVGALVLGTAFPHFVQYTLGDLGWQGVLIATSAAAAIGGLLLYLTVPNGPFRQKSKVFDPMAIWTIFRYPKFRAAAFGYFGHMWELYAFWAFLPFVLHYWFEAYTFVGDVSLWSFIGISMGSLGCVVGGYISLRKNSKMVAFYMLLVSGILCLLSPLILQINLAPLFLGLMLLWGFCVVGDSPQFSTLVAQNAPAEFRGSALTIVNCIGFAITIGSIQLLNYLNQHYPTRWLLLPLVIGPIFGLLALNRQKVK